MNLAVVTIVHGRHEHLRLQQRSLLAGQRRPTTYVVVAMDDPAVDAVTDPRLHAEVVELPRDPVGLPLARARNRGVERAWQRGAEGVVLLDVDCLAGPELVQGYADALTADPDVVWSGPVTYLPPAGPGGYDLAGLANLDRPHPARPAPAPGELRRDADPHLFWSLSCAVHRSTWQRIGGFCEEYVGYGGEDTDFARSAVASGVRLGWAGTPRAYHQHHATSDPPFEHLDDILRNGALFHARWGWWPMSGWLEAFARHGLVERVGTGWRRREPRSPGAGAGRR